MKNFFKINWFKFFIYNFLNKRIVRKTHTYIFPYWKTKIIVKTGGHFFIFSNVHIGVPNLLSLRQKTMVIVGENAKISIANYCTIMRGGVIECCSHSDLEIGGGDIGSDVFIRCAESISIGEKVLISRNVVIRDNDGHKIIRENYKKTKPIFVGDYVWLCERCCILKGSYIGDNSIVGFGVILREKIENNTVVVTGKTHLHHKIDGWRY